MITLNVPEIRLVQPLTRLQFDALIGPDIRAVGACVDRALVSADLRPSDVDVVLRTGGSSHIASYRAMLAATFGEERLYEMDAFTGVAAGLSIAAAEPRLLDQLRASGAVMT